MKAIPPVQKFMSYIPKSIEFNQSIVQANDYMRKLRLRHLPVLKDGEIVGILTDRDIKLVMSFNGVDAEKMTVQDACISEPYSTSPSTPLNDVVAHMAEHKYGCALIVDNGKLVGIFTETDAYKALAELLITRLNH